MGTNFYLANQPKDADSMDPAYHIGKRSAAGWYCWDCGTTLVVGGEAFVHTGAPMAEACPKCGKKPAKESLSASSAGRELGFNKSAPKRKAGVRSCSSFTWAQNENVWKQSRRKYPVVDEYGRKYTRRQFLAVLRECPIRYTRMVGQWFS